MSPSSGGLVVLVDEAAEAVTALDRAAGRGLAAAPRLRRTQVERAVRPLAVVVLDVRAEDVLEVAAVEDQQPVQALGADGADEPLRDRVGECRRLRSFRVQPASQTRRLACATKKST